MHVHSNDHKERKRALLAIQYQVLLTMPLTKKRSWFKFWISCEKYNYRGGEIAWR